MKKALPNILTISRLILMPVSLYFFEKGLPGFSLAIYVIIALTDFWDGHFARRWNACSSSGIVLDQVSDKLVGLGFFFGLTSLNLCPAWFLTFIVIISLFMGLGYAVSQLIPSQSGPQSSLKIGKWNTALQYLWIGWILFSESFFGKKAFFFYLTEVNHAGFVALAFLQGLVFLNYAARTYRNHHSPTDSVAGSGKASARFDR